MFVQQIDNPGREGPVKSRGVWALALVVVAVVCGEAKPAGAGSPAELFVTGLLSLKAATPLGVEVVYYRAGQERYAVPVAPYVGLELKAIVRGQPLSTSQAAARTAAVLRYGRAVAAELAPRLAPSGQGQLLLMVEPTVVMGDALAIVSAWVAAGRPVPRLVITTGDFQPRWVGYPDWSLTIPASPRDGSPPRVAFEVFPMALSNSRRTANQFSSALKGLTRDLSRRLHPGWPPVRLAISADDEIAFEDVERVLWSLLTLGISTVRLGETTAWIELACTAPQIPHAGKLSSTALLGPNTAGLDHAWLAEAQGRGLIRGQPREGVVVVMTKAQPIEEAYNSLRHELRRLEQIVDRDKPLNIVWTTAQGPALLYDKIRLVDWSNFSEDVLARDREIPIQPSSDPGSAVLKALADKPALVVIVTDVDLTPQTVDALLAQTGGGCRFCGVGFQQPTGQTFKHLQRLIEATGGVFKLLAAPRRR